MKISNWLQLILAITLCQAAGVIGSFYAVQAIPEWYATLQKPIFNPPNWIFGPVWLALYFMMALALYLIWQKGWSQNKIRLATGVFLVQLVLNALWSIIFFGMRNPSLAFAEIILLWISILVSIVMFGLIDRRASYLLMPYGLWVSFAAILNFYLWQLNR
ncbi:MAG: tryptophan-rich sensory protein [Candidatus Omnitrophica bacterium]|nr:tryptophan-rich sensory protein [Candidatus Omnitrophota bacterium]